MTKQEIRKEMRARRRAVDTSCRARYSAAICSMLAADRRIAAARTIAVYLAIDDEIDLAGFIASAKRSHRILAPKWDGLGYALAEITESGLTVGHLGISEPSDGIFVSPAEVDLWLVPGLAFTEDGRRLGYGGGYYDRYFAAARADSLKIAIAYPFQILDDLPCQAHDAKVDEVWQVALGSIKSD